jgi:hypothetical protein
MTRPTASAMHPDTFATDFTPAWAVTCWCDDEFVYVALPVKNAAPYIQKFPLTEGGMTKAINILRVQRKTLAHGKPHKVTQAPITRYGSLRPLSDTNRAKVLAAMKKAGIVR